MTAGRLTPRARALRQTGGLAEQRLWARLRGGAVVGWKLRRQHRIDGYVADFACIPLRLAIEIDGGVHQRDDVALRDVYRQRAIETVAGPWSGSPTTRPCTSPGGSTRPSASRQRRWGSDQP